MRIDIVVYAYNTSTHEATGISLYELVFFRTARTPLELDLGTPLKNQCTQHSQSICRSLQSLKQIAQQNLTPGPSRQKRYSDQQLNEWAFYPVDGSFWPLCPKSLEVRQKVNWTLQGYVKKNRSIALFVL